MWAGALERYEFQRPGQGAHEKSLVAESPDDGQVRCIQLGDAAVLDHHPGDVRAAEPQEGLPLSVRLSVGRLLDEAGLEDVRRDSGLYVALWRGGADAWRRQQAVRPLTPQALGSHALLVAVHPEGAEVVFGTDRLLLAGDGVVLAPTSGTSDRFATAPHPPSPSPSPSPSTPACGIPTSLATTAACVRSAAATCGAGSPHSASAGSNGGCSRCAGDIRAPVRSCTGTGSPAAGGVVRRGAPRTPKRGGGDDSRWDAGGTHD